MIGIDATTLEANAAMKTIVRKDTGEDWNEHLRKLAIAEGIENPTDEDLRRLDRKRKDKKVSNKDWESPTDPSRLQGRTRGGPGDQKAIVAAEVHAADLGDPSTGPETLRAADQNVEASG